MKKLLLVLGCSLLICGSPVIQSPAIEVQPYEGLSESYVQEIYKKLLLSYPRVILNKPIKLPKSGLVGGRYRSDTLLKYLRKSVKSGNTIIGLTGKDITCRSGNYTDWGIFGYGDCPGTACVISSYRLNKINLSTQLYKTAIHELGHTFGLDHCPIAGCLMSDAKGKNTMDKENSFCTKCKSYLVSQHWIL